MNNKLDKIAHDDLGTVNNAKMNYSQLEEWNASPSGQIYESLMSKGYEDVSVLNKGRPVEFFVCNGEVAKFKKKLNRVDMRGGEPKIQYMVESWEYNNFGWWKEALDTLDVEIIFLDTPLYKAAGDAGVSESHKKFSAPGILEEQEKALRVVDGRSKNDILIGIRSDLVNIVQPSLEDYTLEYREKYLRLFPVLDDGSRMIEDKEKYLKSIQPLKKMEDLVVAKFFKKKK